MSDLRTDPKKQLGVKGGCDCDWWRNCAKKVGIGYDGFWDETYDEDMKPTDEVFIHEWFIKNTIIRHCPGCGKQLPIKEGEYKRKTLLDKWEKSREKVN